MAERETEDRRVRKTKKQLRGALTSLLLYELEITIDMVISSS